MTRSTNAKTASVTKGIGKTRNVSEKPRGRSGTYRLKQLNTNDVQNPTIVKGDSWLRRLFKR